MDYWKYEEKVDLESSRTELLSKKCFEDYVFLSNNACESLNHLINSLIAINHNVTISRFEIILKTLFIRIDSIDNIKSKFRAYRKKKTIF